MLPDNNTLAPSTSTSSFKRPRVDPPSPSSSPSPKRAASEDPVSTSSSGPDLPSPLSYLSESNQPASSSPLRMEIDDDSQDTTAWVERTGQVSLDEGRLAAADAEALTSAVPATQEKAKDVYDALLESMSPNFQVGNTYYLLPKAFLTAFTQYAMGDGTATRPELDLTSLQESTDSKVYAPGRTRAVTPQNFWPVRPGLIEDEDFVYIGPDGWDKLVAFYDYPETKTVFPRIALPDGRVELAPNVFCLHMIKSIPTIPVPPATPPPALLITMPRTTRLDTFRDAIRSIFDIPGSTSIRAWMLEGAEIPNGFQLAAKDLSEFKGKVVQGMGDTIEDAGFANGDHVAVEVQEDSGKWAVEIDRDGKPLQSSTPAPLFAKPGFYGSNPPSSSNQLLNLKGGVQTRSQSRGREGGKGLVGLSNLGNTCFLASATQCLSNTAVLIDYFLTGVYLEELNRDNPLGMHGQIAEAFGDVIENLWQSPSFSSFAPRRLKTTCSRFAPQFAGYGQHDTQEFLAFLLDGLHEDLNRIKQKPYIEKPDWKPGGGDKELAELGKECWEGYKKRNDSVIVDLFQGQLQSTLVCPECHNESITMDPFMYLTVPLPISQTRIYKCIFVPRDTERPPVNVEILVPANAPFTTVKEKLGQLCKAQANNLIGIDLWKGGIYNWWLDSEPTTTTGNNDISVFYELAVPTVASFKGVGTTPKDGSVTVPVFSFRESRSSSSYRSSDNAPGDCQLEPFFITLSKADASDPVAVQEAIMRGYTRLVRPDLQEDLWVPSNAPEAKYVPEDDESAPASSPKTETSARLEEASPRKSNELTAPSAISRSQSSVSVMSQSGRLVPRRDLFKIYVADASSADSSSGMGGFFSKKDSKIQPLYKGYSPSAASRSWSSLNKRTRAKRPVFSRMASSFTSLVAPSSAANTDDEDEGEPMTAVRSGEAVFVQWKGDKFDEFFEPSRDSVLRSLETVVDPAIAKDLAKKKEGRAISLDDCLDEFSKEETLGQDDLWYCPVCKKHQAATKKLDIYKAPDILVICLKRFGSSRTLRDKLDHLVKFPIDGLDLDERVGERRVTKELSLTPEEAKHYGIEHSTEPFIYDLFAVDNHFGGLGGGHYTAFCRNKDDQQWYNYDDSRVSKASASSVQDNRAAYLLFYKRRTGRKIGGISRIKAEEASRQATPMGSIPSSPQVAPQHINTTISPDSSDDDSAPMYTAYSNPPSYVSAPEIGVASSIGYGNSLWTPTRAQEALDAPPTPESDDDFLPVGEHFLPANAVPSSGTQSRGESGLGEPYDVVPSNDTSDAEMVSLPTSEEK